MKLRKNIFGLFVITLAFGLAAEENLLKNGDFSKGNTAWTFSGLSFRGTEKGAVVEAPAGAQKFSSLMMQELNLKEGTGYRLSIRMKCGGKGIFRAVYQQKQKPWTAAGLVKEWKLEPGTHELETAFTALPRNGAPAHLTLNFSRMSGPVELSSVRICRIDDLPFAVSSEWSIVWDKSKPDFRSVPPGSAKAVMGKTGIDLRRMNPEKFRKETSTAILYNRFHSDKEGLMRIGFAADWSFDIYLNGTHCLKAQGPTPLNADSNFHKFHIRKGENILVAVVRAGSRGWGFLCAEPRDPVVFREGKNWKAYRSSNLEIIPGSALDLSAQNDAPAGKYGPAVLSPDGRVVFENAPEQPVRLLGFNTFAMNGIMAIKDNDEFKAAVRRFAQAAKRQGYNLFRTQSFDRWLVLDSKQEYQLNPFYLDRTDFLIAELKKQGIYTHLPIFNFNLFSRERNTFRDRTLHKFMMYFDGEWEMKHFRFGVKSLLEHVNPYTGVAWKDEPAIFCIEYYNEQSLGLGDRMFSLFRTHPEAEKHILKFWRAWLEKKYGRPMPDAQIPRSGQAKHANDFALFCMDRAKASAEQCEKIIRETGFRGLVTNYSYSKQLGHSAARWQTSQITDVHSYFNHPTANLRKGSVVKANSSIEAKTGYWKDANATKLLGRPFISGEYNHCFWNPYRYEAGMVFGAYSALQGYAAITVHQQPVVLNSERRLPLDNFTAGFSPLSRAAQFLSANLFQRGDVKESPHAVALNVPREFLEKNLHADKAVSSAQSILSLLSGFGLVFPDENAAEGTVRNPRADLSFPVSNVAQIYSHDWFSDVIQSADNSFSLPEAVNLMKRKGILPSGNITDPARGIFQSDTGEILLNAPEKRMTVVTPRTEAVCMTAGNAQNLKIMELKNSSADSCTALTSVDGMPLEKSRRMVLLYMTEEANSGMTLAADRATMLDCGKSPVLARTGTLNITVRRRGNWKLHALAPDGSRCEEIPVARSANGLEIQIDTAALRNGPTPFFELEETL